MGRTFLESVDVLPHCKLGIAKFEEGIQDTLGHGVGKSIWRWRGLRSDRRWLVAGRLPGSFRHFRLPAVLAICCRVPAGGRQRRQRAYAALHL